MQIETNCRVTELPQAPGILAVPLNSARNLLRDLDSEWSRVVLLDLA